MSKKKRTSLSIFAVFIMAGTVFVGIAGGEGPTNESQPPSTEWIKTYGGPRREFCSHGMAELTDGYLLLGDTTSYGAGGMDFFLVRTDENGNKLWHSTYGGSLDDSALDMTVSSDGNYLLIGDTYNFGHHGNEDVWLLKIDKNGNIIWSKTYGRSDKDEQGNRIIQTRDGGYMILGMRLNSPSTYDYDILLIKIDRNGNYLWEKTIGGPYYEFPNFIVQTDDGGYAITAYTFSYGAGSADYWLVKTDEHGNKQWDVTFGGPSADYCLDGIQTSDGGFLLCGQTYSYGHGSGDDDIWIIKTNSNGVKQWDRKIGTTKSEFGFPIIETIDGGFLIAGGKDRGNGKDDVYVVKIDEHGNKLWDATFGGYSTTEKARALMQTTDGGYLIGAWTYSTGPEDQDMYYIKMNPEEKNFIQYWSYPNSDKDFEIEMYEPYEIVLHVKNLGATRQYFNFGLSRPRFTCYNVFKNEIFPLWDIKESTTCTINGMPYSFGIKLTDVIGPGETREYIFCLKSHWQWLPEQDFSDIITPAILSACSEMMPSISTIEFLKAITDLYFKNVPIIEYNFCGIGDSKSSSRGSVKVWTTEEKNAALAGSLINMALSGFDTSLGVKVLASGIGAPLAVLCFVAEGGIMATSKDLYDKSFDPDPNFTEIANPYPPYLPALENISNSYYGIAKLIVNQPSFSYACAKSYAKYLGSLEAGSAKWATIQFSATRYYLYKLYNTTKEIYSMFDTIFPDIPPATPEDIAIIRNYLSQKGLPEIEVNMLKYYGFTDEQIDKILQNLLLVDDNFYYKAINNFSQEFKNYSLSLEPLLEYYSTAPKGALLVNVETDHEAIDVTNPPATLTCYVEFYNISNLTDYQIISAVLNDKIIPLSIALSPGDHDNDGIDDIAIEYDTAEIISMINEGELLLSILGNVTLPSSNTSLYSGSVLLTVNGEPPYSPLQPSGPTIGFADNHYTYSASTADPENSQIYFMFDWGDRTNSGWLGPYNSGECCNASHSWSSPGVYNLKVRAKDIWNHTSNWSPSLTVKIREPTSPHPPTPPKLPEPDVFIHFDGPHEWNLTHWEITPETLICFDMKVADEEAGIVELYYRIDNGSWTRYTGCFTLPLGLHYLYYYGIDENGIHSNAACIVIKVVNNLAPLTTCNLNPSLPDGGNGWYISNVTITLTAKDDISGVDSTYYKLDNDGWIKYLGSITIPDDGEHTIKYYSIDKAGNMGETKSAAFKIDKTKPTITFKKPTYGYLYLMGKEILPLGHTVIIGKAMITVECNDETSEIRRVEFYVDDELKEVVTSEPFEWLWDESILGIHTIKAIVYDIAGNMAIDEQEVWIFNL